MGESRITIREIGFSYLRSWRYLHDPWSHVQLLPHNIFLVGPYVRSFCIDQAALVKVNQCIVHQPHPLLLSSLNYTRQHEGFIFANHVGDSRCIGENLKREHATGSILARDQLMTNDATQ